VRRLLSLVAAIAGALLFAAPAFADNAGLTPVAPQSPSAESINDLYWILVGVTGVIFVVVQGALLAFIIRYRRGARPRTAEGPQIHGHTRLELIWTVIPVLILAVLAGLVFLKLPDLEGVSSAAASPAEERDTLRIEVEGRRFYWQYTYPDGAITYDTLVVPVGRVVELVVTAPDYDVVHSYWIPALNGKRDAIPGSDNTLYFRATREGEYEGTCTEFCGVQHSAMTASVRAVAPERYEAERARLVDALGQQTFEAVCAKCHNVEGPQLIGPTLRGNPILAERESLAEIVRNGQGEMPAVGRGWSEEQLDALFEYVRRFGGESGG
jgi:cytochrome c oxidase subunit II